MSILESTTNLKINNDDVLKREAHFIECFKKYKDKKIKLLFSLFKGFRKDLFISIIVYIIKDLPVWIVPIITANIITLIQKQPDDILQKLILNLVIGIASVAQNPITHFIQMSLLNKSRRNVEAGLRGAMIRKFQQLSIAFHKETPSGKLQSKVMRDVDNFINFTTHIFTSVLSIIAGLIVTLNVILRKNIWVFIMFLLCIPIGAFLSKTFRKPIKKGAKEFRLSVENTSADVINMIEYIPVTRAHALESKEIDKLTTTVVNAAKTGYKYDTVLHFFASVSWASLAILQLCCLGFTSFLAVKGQITDIGDIALYQSYFTSLIAYANGILGLLPVFTSGFESIDSMGEILISDDVENTEQKFYMDSLEGNYEFKNVSFQYDENSPALNNFSLNVKKGETIAFVGESGSGKSTVINLVTGFYKANKGQLLIDGKDIADINLPSYRRFISVVPQKTILFSGSVRDNITYGSDYISDEELKNVIKAAQLESVIERLPNGLETNIGEHGDKLSGGQRQRISIARAIIRNPQVIIFDEATSALDSASEREIQKAIDYLTKDRTTFIVAHRLSTIRNADRIVVVDDGRCIECGTFDELMAKKGAFYKLKSLQ